MEGAKIRNWVAEWKGGHYGIGTIINRESAKEEGRRALRLQQLCWLVKKDGEMK